MTRFPNTPLVSPGDPVTDAQYNGLAYGVIARGDSGLGDPVARYALWWHGLLRGMFCPNGDLYAADTEAWAWMALDPSLAQYPNAMPGEAGGVNPANPLAAFVHGQESFCDGSQGWLPPENERLALLTGLPTALAALPPELRDLIYWDALWSLRVAQCGAWSPATGEESSPALQAAQALRGLYHAPGSVFGQDYGGFLPVPAVNPAMPTCGDAVIPGDPETVNRTIWFTRLTEPGIGDRYDWGGGKLATGTCPNVAGDAMVYEIAPFYHVYVVNPATESGWEYRRLSMREWLYGPFEGGGVLRKSAAGHWPRLLRAWAGEWRGNDVARNQAGGMAVDPFPFTKVLTTQFLLAPVIGTASGPPEARVVSPVYPRFETAGCDAGTTLVCTTNGLNAYPAVTGAVVTGAYLRATGLDGPVSVQAVVAGVPRDVVTLTPDANGTAAWIAILGSEAMVSGTVAWRAVTPIRFSGQGSLSGRLRIDTSIQMAYRPERDGDDVYALLRAATANTNDALDGSGTVEPGASYVAEIYFTHGVIWNQNGLGAIPDTLTINRNAVFDTVRRLSRTVRVIPPEKIVKYGVVGGQSVLWVDRYANVGGQTVDVFAGLGPDTRVIASGDLELTVRYRVESGSVVHDFVTYTAGQVFAATETTYTGTGIVREYDGIRLSAPQRGVTNEWWGGDGWLKVYHPAESNNFKPSRYGSVVAVVDRCLVDSPELSTAHPDLLWFFNHGATGALKPEAVSGHRYAAGIVNQIDRYDGPPTDWQRVAFARSCRRYEPPCSIESAVMDGAYLKLTFTGRWHHVLAYADGDASWPDAPAAVNPDLSAWTLAELNALQAQPYRTLENGVLQLLVDRNRGIQPQLKLGDTTANSNAVRDGELQGWTVLGACWAHLYFVQKPRRVWSDANAVPDPENAPLWHELLWAIELWTRVMAGGAVDLEATFSSAPTTFCQPAGDGTYLMDYTVENLYLQATGNRWATLLPLSVRPDNIAGTPLPGAPLYAEQYNQLASALAKLRRYRLDGVHGAIQWHERTYTGRTGVVSATEIGTPDTGGTWGAYADGVTPVAATTRVDADPAPGDEEAFNPPGGFSPRQVCMLVPTLGSPTVWQVETRRVEIRYWWEPSAAWAETLPPPAASLIASGDYDLVARVQHSGFTSDRQAATPGGGDLCPDVYGLDVWGDFHWDAVALPETDDCLAIRASGTFNAALPGRADFNLGHQADEPDYPAGFCSTGGSQTLTTVTIVDVNSLYLHVPLVSVYWGTSAAPLLDAAGVLALPPRPELGGEYVFTPSPLAEEYLYVIMPATDRPPLPAAVSGPTGFMTGGLNMVGDLATTADGYPESDGGWPYRELLIDGLPYRVYRSHRLQRSAITVTVTATP